MPTDAEVRTWCREQGIDVPQRGKLNPSFHEQWRDAHPNAEPDAVDGQLALGDEQLVDEQPPALRVVDEPGAETGETPPRSPRAGRRLSLFGRAAAAKSKGPRRRVSLESTCAAGWSILSAAAAQAGQTPTARVLAMQAPVAGVILEDSLKGTLADKILQPLARVQATGSKVGALLAPPLLVTLLDRKPHLAPQLLPVLRLALREWVMVAGPAMKAQEKKQARAMEALGLEGDDGLDALVDGMVEGIFGEGVDDEQPADERAVA